MKKCTYTYILMTAMLLLATLAVVAATEQWRYDGWHIIYQVAADGTGGCALYRVTTNGSASVVWLDKNGQAQYDRVMEAAALINPIVYCSKKTGLAFTAFTGNPTNKVIGLVLVDKKLKETVTTVPGKNVVPGSYPYGSTGTANFDKKGFFVTEISTNGIGSVLVRYTYK